MGKVLDEVTRLLAESRSQVKLGDIEKWSQVEQTGSFAPGDKVEVVGPPHEGGATGKGVVVAIADTPAYSVRFNGADEVHKWYVGSELRKS